MSNTDYKYILEDIKDEVFTIKSYPLNPKAGYICTGRNTLWIPFCLSILFPDLKDINVYCLYNYSDLAMFLNLSKVNQEYHSLYGPMMGPVVRDSLGDIRVMAFVWYKPAVCTFFHFMWREFLSYRSFEWIPVLCRTKWFNRCKSAWNINFDELKKRNIEVTWNTETKKLFFNVNGPFGVQFLTTFQHLIKDDEFQYNTIEHNGDLNCIPGPVPIIFKLSKNPPQGIMRLDRRELKNQPNHIGQMNWEDDLPFLEENSKLVKDGYHAFFKTANHICGIQANYCRESPLDFYYDTDKQRMQKFSSVYEKAYPDKQTYYWRKLKSSMGNYFSFKNAFV